MFPSWHVISIGTRTMSLSSNFLRVQGQKLPKRVGPSRPSIDYTLEYVILEITMKKKPFTQHRV